MTPRALLRGARRASAWCVGATGAAGGLLRRSGGRQLRILVYHRVSDPGRTYGPCVSPVHFEAHVRHLARFCDVRRLCDIVSPGRLVDLDPRRPPVAVTFDDGYADVATHAYPILRRHRVPATVFVSSACLDGGPLPWMDTVEEIVRRCRSAALEPIAGIPGARRSLRDDAERREAVFRLWDALQRKPTRARDESIRELARRAGISLADVVPDGRMLTWEQIRSMDAGLVEIGSHTATHAALAEAGREEAVREVTDSKRCIEAALGRPVHGFSYPNDSRAGWLPDLLRSAGYAYACYVGGRPNPLPLGDPMGLFRIHVEDWSLPVFEAELGPYGDWVRSRRSRGAPP